MPSGRQNAAHDQITERKPSVAWFRISLADGLLYTLEIGVFDDDESLPIAFAGTFGIGSSRSAIVAITNSQCNANWQISCGRWHSSRRFSMAKIGLKFRGPARLVRGARPHSRREKIMRYKEIVYSN